MGELTLRDYRRLAKLIQLVPTWRSVDEPEPSALEWQRFLRIADAMRQLDPQDVERALLVFESEISCGKPVDRVELTRALVLVRGLFATELQETRASEELLAVRHAVVQNYNVDTTFTNAPASWPLDFTGSDPVFVDLRPSRLANGWTGPPIPRYHPHSEFRTMCQLLGAPKAVSGDHQTWRELASEFRSDEQR